MPAPGLGSTSARCCWPAMNSCMWSDTRFDGGPMTLDIIPLSRRAFLSQYAGSLGPLALAYLVAQQQATAESGRAVLNAASTAGAGKAKSVICLFQHGGPSQMDLFDPKPELTKWNGKPYPGGNLEIHFDKQAGNVLGSPYAFKKYGECGMEMSELLPFTGGIADDITLVRSMSTESVDHE